MVVIIYFLMSLLAVLFALLETGNCTSGGCSTVPGLLGRSWYLWGAVFYAVAAMLCSWFKKHIAIGTYLLVGALFHVLLVVYGYQVSGEICSVCWKFSAVDSLLVLVYWFMPKKKTAPTSWLTVGPIKALGIISLSLLIVNSVTESVTIPDVIAETDLTKRDYIAEAGPADKESSETEYINTTFTGEVNCQLRVLTLTGKSKCLDIKSKPALVFAAWCPHCDDALKKVAKLPQEKQPYLVVTYLREGDVEKAEKKLKQNGLGSESFYLAITPPTELEAVPSYLYWNDGLEVFYGR
jgi:glutaredoxin